MNVVLFEDELVGQLSPITLLRPAYTITCGGLRLLDLALALGKVRGVVRPQLRDFQSDYFVDDFDPQQPTLYLNARLAPDIAILPRLRELAASADQDGTSWCASQHGVVTAAFTKVGSTLDISTTDSKTLVEFLSCQLPSTNFEAQTFEYPHNVIEKHPDTMVRNLEYRIRDSRYQEIADGVFASTGTKPPANVSFETAKGPILLEENVAVGAFSVLRGPVSLGANTIVSPHTLLKGPVSVGHTCKVGGEISAAVIEPFTNKVHFGYVGTSYLGSWVNLGAGTTNSNLKNTYGNIRVTYDDKKIDTGMQFLGCVIGDFTKTAINTSIYTGKILGVCSNVYGTVTTNVPSFSNFARSFGEITEHPAEVMKATQRRVFERRKIQQEPRHIQLLQEVYAAESEQRKLADHPPSL